MRLAKNVSGTAPWPGRGILERSHDRSGAETVDAGEMGACVTITRDDGNAAGPQKTRCSARSRMGSGPVPDPAASDRAWWAPGRSGLLDAVAYPGKETAEKVRSRLMQLATEHVIELEDAVVVDRDEDGKAKLHQIHRPAAAHTFLDPTALGRQEDWEEPKGRAAVAHDASPDVA